MCTCSWSDTVSSTILTSPPRLIKMKWKENIRISLQPSLIFGSINTAIKFSGPILGKSISSISNYSWPNKLLLSIIQSLTANIGTITKLSKNSLRRLLMLIKDCMKKKETLGLTIDRSFIFESLHQIYFNHLYFGNIFEMVWIMF